MIAEEWSPEYDYTDIFALKSLTFEVHMIGYETQGEAILFFIKADGVVTYSGLIDCYKQDDLNLVQANLDREKVSSLSFLCWTHPDMDHSKGLDEIIKKYTSKSTDIWLPQDVQKDDDARRYVGDVFNALSEGVKQRKILVSDCSDIKDLAQNKKYRFNYLTSTYPLEIWSFAPSSAILHQKFLTHGFHPNDYSAVLYIKIGRFDFLFTGDAEDQSIQCFSNQVSKFPSIYFVKIPHHGSCGSKLLVDSIQHCNYSCSSMFVSGVSRLPEASIIYQYKELSEECCVTNYIEEEKRKKYGEILLTIDIPAEKANIQLKGGAHSIQ